MNKLLKNRNRFMFYKRKAYLDDRVKNDYIDNGVAYIPCKVKNIYDIFSTYCIEDYETLNESFSSYVKRVAEVIPSEYPLVLDIIGANFTKSEKENIEKAIKDCFAYDLGKIEKRNYLEFRSMILSLILAIVTGILTTVISKAAGISKEIIVILFYFFVDTLVDYLFFQRVDYNHEKVLAGRLSCVKITFSKEFNKEHFSDEEIQSFYNEIKKY